MRYIILLLSFTLSLFALEISIDGGKESSQKYSILHLKDTDNFLCQSQLDDFKVTTKIICAFKKKPSQKIAFLETDFFSIENKIKDDTFFLIIKPKKKMKLYPILFDLKNENTTFHVEVELAKDWLIVGYDEKIPYIKTKEVENGLNLPFFMDHDNYPYVGGLDMKGHPIHIKKVEDVTDYIKIKKDFKAKNYDKALERIDTVLQKYPNSLFRAELLYYKIKVYNKLNDNDNLIENSKEYLKEYSGDENVPEVLALTANAYSNIGMNIDADYFFDRLFDEHKNSVYTQWGYIYKGDMLEASGASHKAIQFYKKALIETKDLDVAVSAAYRLAFYYLDKGKYKEASEYITKVSKVDPSYFMKDFKKSLDMAYSFADAQKYNTAATIATGILSQINKDHDEYERLLKDRALWLTKTKHKKEALKALNQYIKEFPYGDFAEDVKVAKDELFFDLNDSNASQKLAKYDELISEYKGDTIANKALYEKAKLLLKEKKYGDVLGIKDSILDLDEDIYKGCDEIVKDAAKGSMKRYLKNNECQAVLDMSKEYNITLSYEWDDSIFKCAMKGAEYGLSKKIATRNLKTKNLQQRKKWLFRYIKIDFATGNYTEVIKASKDLIALIEIDKQNNQEYIEIYRYLFDTYERLEDNEGMIDAIADIEKVFGVQTKDIGRYNAMVALGVKLKDDTLIITYGTKVMQLQKRSATYTESPFIEFTLYQAYRDKEEYQKAIEVLKVLDKVKLSSSQRARASYLLGSLYDKLNKHKKAIECYNRAIKADKKSAWGELAQDAKEI